MKKLITVWVLVFGGPVGAADLMLCYDLRDNPYGYEHCMNQNMDELLQPNCFDVYLRPLDYQYCMNENMMSLGLPQCFGIQHNPAIFEECMNDNMREISGG